MSSNNSHTVQSGGKQRVLVNVILDKSGSMSTKVQDVIGGFNLYLDELAKESAVDYGFSLTLFDTVVEMKYKAVALAKVAKLDDTTYRPSGNTALLDAIGNTVQTVSTDGFNKTITVVMTDGEENSSREWTLQAIRELIRSKEAAGNWTFVFLGANLDAFEQGTNLGVPMANSVRYDPANYRAVYASLAKSTNEFSADTAKAADSFFKGEVAGIMEQKRSRTKKGGGKHGIPARRRNELSREEIKRHLREAEIVKMEPILAGTGYWGLAEGKFANAISDEKDPKRKKAMARRYEELAVQLKDLSRKEREQILLEEIKKWKKEAKE